MYESFLVFKGTRYAILAVGFTVLCVVLFALHDPAESRNGGTWLGYVLGTAGALLIVWLSCLGIRKRAYQSTLGSVEGWLSWHVYFGASLLVIATLHTTGELGWNVHSLAYILMLIVILSGFYGVYLYRIYPGRLMLNLADSNRDTIRAEIKTLDEHCNKLLKNISGDVQAVALSALERTSLSDSIIGRISGHDGSKVMLPDADGLNPRLVENKDQSAVLDYLSSLIAESRGGSETVTLRDIVDLFSERRRLLSVLRRDIQMREKLRIWLFVHVPFTLALLAALLVHILVVFIYW